ncbi:MAG: 4a-hydroxytetrahydrobiopterin dehydratase [Acidimicrobiia bacterium]
MAKLSDDEVQDGLAALTAWRREGDEIVRDLECETFPAAIALVGRIAELAEAADHHPDIDIRYNRLRVALTSHDAGGLTQRDLNLATRIEALVPEKA